MMLKFGLSAALCLAYLATVLLVPIDNVATAMGICGFFARVSTIFAPIVAEIQQPVPNAILAIMALAAVLITQVLRKYPK